MDSIYKWALIYFNLLSTIGLIISLIIADNDIMRGLTSSIAFLTVFSMLFVPKKYIEKALIRVLTIMVIATFIEKLFTISQSGLNILVANSMSMNDYKASLASHNSACIYHHLYTTVYQV